MERTSPSSDLSTRAPFRRLRFRFWLFFVRMWLVKAFRRRIFPLPVFLKRLAAELLVFILGSDSVLCVFGGLESP